MQFTGFGVLTLVRGEGDRTPFVPSF